MNIVNGMGEDMAPYVVYLYCSDKSNLIKNLLLNCMLATPLALDWLVGILEGITLGGRCFTRLQIESVHWQLFNCMLLKRSVSKVPHRGKCDSCSLEAPHSHCYV